MLRPHDGRSRRGRAGGWCVLWAAVAWGQPAAVAGATSAGEAFGHSPQARRQSLESSAAAVAAQLGAAQLEVESRVAVVAGASEHHQVDHVRLEWDALGGMALAQSCGATPLELWRIGDALFVRSQRGPVRQKTSRDMDAAALFDQAQGTFAQALAWLAPLRYLEGTPDRAAGRAGWRYRLEVAPTSGQNDARTPPGPATTRPSLWRQTLSERQVEGFVTIDEATGVLVEGEMRALATLVHPAAPAAKITAVLRHRIEPRGRGGALTAPPAVSEFRRQLRLKDPIAFYRQPRAPAARPTAAPRHEGDDEPAGDEDVGGGPEVAN